VSPLSLRRYRAERLLRHEFEALRRRVLATVERRLRAAGSELDRCDLEACYAAAWQGLYTSVLEGTEIANPAAWLVLVTFRRAIEERRARTRAHRGAERMPIGVGAGEWSGGAQRAVALACERDLAAELDDRVRLRRLFEGLRGRLSEREREAAVLCYLQGLTRAEAAARMGVSETGMRKLMEGRGPGGLGVAGKVGALVASIRDGEWCEEQGSLMRALAFGVLEPRGERHRLALAHTSDCPACRSYVASLRGLAAALPPVLAPWGLAAASLARSGGLAHLGACGAAGATGAGGAAGATGVGGATGAGGATGTGGAGGGGGVGSALGGRLGGAVSSSGAAGAGAGAGGAAGGGWLLAGGPLGGKLALGCLMALGVGAGCAALAGRLPEHASSHRRAALTARASRSPAPPLAGLAARAAASVSASASASSSNAAPGLLTPVGRASREFGPEQALAAGAQPNASAVSGSASAPRPVARAASSRGGTAAGLQAREGAASAAGASTPALGSQVASAGATQAAREFSPG
jgi:RNA polymerase sigma factor (sigma-70 family)